MVFNKTVAEHNLGCLSTINTSPKWTFGGKPNDATIKSDELYPGPNSYDINIRAVRPTSPQYGFGTTPRLRDRTSAKSPGPGAYDPKVVKFSPQWTLAGRHGQQVKDDGPGPGDYTNVLKGSSNAPSYSMGKETRGMKPRDSSPGPGQYTPTYISPNAPKWGLGSSPRGYNPVDSQKNSIPGPGTYQPLVESVMKKSAQYSMGSRPNTLGSHNDSTPGPGAYKIDTNATQANKFSFGVRTSTRTTAGDAPGPGAYSPVTTIAHTSPKWVFSSAKRQDLRVSAVPGPGSYDVKPSQKTPAWTFGTGGASCPLKSNGVPAPGSYNVQSKIGEGLKFSMGNAPRKGLAGLSDSPGPCHYNPNINQTVPKWGFGSSKRADLSVAKNTPGPGSYTPRYPENQKGWTISGRHESDAQMKLKSDNGKIGATYSVFGF